MCFAKPYEARRRGSYLERWQAPHLPAHPDQVMPLKWEFPGGKIEEGEQPRDAMRRELDEELGIQANVGDEVTRFRHEYPNGNAVELRFYDVQGYSGDMENKIFRAIRWVQPADLPSYDFLEADLELVKDLANGKLAP